MVHYFTDMSKANIELLLRKNFDPVHLEVVDESYLHAGHAGAKEGGHFVVYITAEAFKGKKLIERHRMVYAAVAPIKHEIHALSIKAQAPGE